ncbi:MAG TPA: putative metal-binding motif-containing protein [Polyangiaceae bacterium]|nr:putative metal-binding motif-containing protein [Polyangiaceae bacterium]
MRNGIRDSLAQLATRLPARSIVALTLSGVIYACGNGSVHSPFHVDAGSEAGAAGAPETDGGLNVGEDAGDPTLGGPCADDSQCTDDFPCTTDRCDQELQRCRHVPDDSVCADRAYCNGDEVCEPKLGCRSGPPVSCADSDPCTIDTCVEKTHTCSRAPRDADGDGDPVWNCSGGGDCDDTDPSVNSKAAEVCKNGKDDNCDGTVDESDCITPAHDVCSQSLTIDASGFTSLSLAATKLDYATKCAPDGERKVQDKPIVLGDIVLALKVPEGDPQDVDVVVQGSDSLVSIATTTHKCDSPIDVTCSPTFGSVSRLHLYGLAPGLYPLYVSGRVGADLSLAVNFSAASSAPSNETCSTAVPIEPGVSQRAALSQSISDLSSVCDPDEDDDKLVAVKSGELVYSFTLPEARDVRVYANPLDDYGAPQLSLRDAGCKDASDELTCRVGSPGSALFARALPAGQYFLSVASSGPGDVDVRLEESAATSPPADQGCANPPPIAAGQTLELSLSDHADAVDVGCLAGAPDSSHVLSLRETSDVLLVARISADDLAAVSLSPPSCTKDARLSCGVATTSPVRAQAYNVPPGAYRAVVESALGSPVTLTAFTRNAVPATLVPFADDCSAPLEIPATGGRFKGNTANQHADFSAGCDLGNQPKNGAPDQLLHLRLETKSHVVLDMGGSKYNTMLSVRTGPDCPGTELQLACAAGTVPSRSFLDLDLESGDYYVQVDGYGGDSGAWSLDVYVTPDSI